MVVGSTSIGTGVGALSLRIILRGFFTVDEEAIDDVEEIDNVEATDDVEAMDDVEALDDVERVDDVEAVDDGGLEGCADTGFALPALLFFGDTSSCSSSSGAGVSMTQGKPA